MVSCFINLATVLPPMEGENLDNDIKKLFNSEYLSDIKFVFPDEKVIFAHSFVLCVRSSVFLDWFGGTIGVPKLLSIDDSPYCDFYEYIKYLYRHSINITSQNVEVILKLARQHKTKCLFQTCVKFILKEIQVENAAKFLELSINDNELEEIRIKSLNFISRNYLKVIRDHSFLNIKFTTLKAVLEIDKVSAYTSEFDIFTEVMKWATHACSISSMPPTGSYKRQQLDTNLKLIRFGAMSLAEFGDCQLIEPGLLTNDEVSAIFVNIANGKVNPYGFSDKKRASYLAKSWKLFIYATILFGVVFAIAINYIYHYNSSRERRNYSDHNRYYN